MVRENLIKGSLVKESLVTKKLVTKSLAMKNLVTANLAEKKLVKGNFWRGLFGVVLAGVLMSMMGCSGKGTVLLEADDLVREEVGLEKGEGCLGTAEGAAEKVAEQAEGKVGEKAAEQIGGKAGEKAIEQIGEQVGEATLFVHICGEVVRPGVYELPKGSRVYEAVEEAGGFTDDAAEDYVNLAYVLEDGWKIEIPAKDSLIGEEGENAEEGAEGKGGVVLTGSGGMTADGKGKNRAVVSAGITADANGMAGVAVAGTGGVADDGMAGGVAAGTAGGMADGLVDINTATKEELLTLPGVGESRAASIIAYREKNGGFSRIEDIMKVEGIKEGMFSKMKDKICVRGVR